MDYSELPELHAAIQIAFDNLYKTNRSLFNFWANEIRGEEDFTEENLALMEKDVMMQTINQSH